ncbi:MULTISPECIES: helical backbone metal receptor [Streptomyces]|uniref:Helical backbone metal receptor n=1 Tax=Streptomyces solicathayae TaxID=3081768 RepID=A0ABZ0M115_9ACTN|nr:helical backbone metal receptor [Streptomyces sp. HUAS YS2]WOX25384.1 helical backbone metal receptor [Streptomyces sp. HUAS YS2]
MRVVSLVPSLTEAIAVTAAAAARPRAHGSARAGGTPIGLLAGVTDWCTHPADLGGAVRIGGTKNPDVAAIVALRPDLVVANEEENREPDLAALRAAGLDVLVTEIRTLPQALAELQRVLRACGLPPRPDWLVEAEAAWADDAAPKDAPDPSYRAVVPIWRRPWMVLGRDTFAGDLLARLGVRQLYADHPERYPRIPLDELNRAGADLVVLPDEPYRFTADDGPEAFPGLPAALVGGRHLTWYGPSLAEAHRELSRELRRAVAAVRR